MTFGFSLRLLENEPSRAWLLCREEPRVPHCLFWNSARVRHSMLYGSKVRILDLLARPVGVVNGLLLGYSLGNYHSVFSKHWCPLDAPRCRRFAMNLNSGEFMEVHWFVEANKCLIYWMHMSSSAHRARYFVLYELPPPGKLPTKLLKSVELLIQREYNENTSQGDLESSFEKDNTKLSLVKQEENKPFSFQGFQDAWKRTVGVFSGTGRRTSYDPVNRTVMEDVTFPYRQVTYFLQEASDKVDGACRGAIEPPLFSLSIPVVSASIVDGIVEELLRQEDLHLQAAQMDMSSTTSRSRLSKEKRWRQRLCRRYKRYVLTESRSAEGLVVPLAAHRAAFHLGLSLSGNFFSENDTNLNELYEGELKERIQSLQTLSSGLWMFTPSGENIFISASRQVKRLAVENETKKYAMESRKMSRTRSYPRTESASSGSSASAASEESANNTRKQVLPNTIEEQEREHSSSLMEKIKALEYENALLIRRVQQLEKEREYKQLTLNTPDFKNHSGTERDKPPLELDYHEELNRILLNIDSAVQSEWELVGRNVDDSDFFF
eukprot:jgi/Galph1/367/GphlegSOOS_G5024.1